MEVKQSERMKPSLLAENSIGEESTAEVLRWLYWDMQFSTLDIAEIFKTSQSNVSHYLRKFNIPCRPRGDSMSLAFKKGKIKRHYAKGKDHFNWRGGRTTKGGGYVLVYQPGHPKAKDGIYVLEHILVWESVHGHFLPDGWVVHHLNGLTDDNRPENLAALPDRKHKTVLAAKARRIRKLEQRLAEAYRYMESLRKGAVNGQMPLFG